MNGEHQAGESQQGQGAEGEVYTHRIRKKARQPWMVKVRGKSPNHDEMLMRFVKVSTTVPAALCAFFFVTQLWGSWGLRRSLSFLSWVYPITKRP